MSASKSSSSSSRSGGGGGTSGAGGGGTSGAASGPSNGASGGVKKPYLFTRELSGSWRKNIHGFPVHKQDLDALKTMTTDGWTLLCDENGFKRDDLTVELQYYAEPTRKTLLRVSDFRKIVKLVPQNKVKGAVEFGLKATEDKELVVFRLSGDGGDGGGVASNNAAALPIAPQKVMLPPKIQWKLLNANVDADSSKQVALEDEVASRKAERGRTRAQKAMLDREEEKKKEKMVVEAEQDKAEQDEESLVQPSVIQQAVAQQVLNVAKVIEEQLDDEISKLERLDDDDLEEQRLMQMKQMAAKRQQWMAQGHGEYQEILSEKDFLAAAKASDRVVCHFYKENWPCKVMDNHLNILSKQHLETRFVKINAEKSPFLTERLKIVMPLPTLALIKNVMLPTLALIKKGKVDDYVVGFDELGGTDEFSTEELEERLARSEIIMADGQSAGDRSKAIEETTTATATLEVSADTSTKNAKADEEYVRVHLSVGAPPC